MSDKKKSDSQALVVHSSAPEGIATLNPGDTVYVQLAPGMPAPAITYEAFSRTALRALRTLMLEGLRERAKAAKAAEAKAAKAAKSSK